MPHTRTTLAGRASEFSSLASVVDALASGRSGAALVEGEAGIGKTRLLDETIRYARGLGVEVSAGAAGALERDRPFGALSDALDLDASSPDRDRAEIGRLLTGEAAPHLAFAQAPELRFRVLEGIVGLLERNSASRPQLILVDDLHWADASTLLALDYLVRHIGGSQVCVVGATRPTSGRADLDRFTESIVARGGQHVLLEPLAHDAVQAMTADLLGAEPAEAVLRQLSSAGGNPFFVTELLATMQAERAITISGGVAEARPIEVPKSLRLIILRRISFLAEQTLEALRIAAVLGSPFSLSDLVTVMGKTAVELMSVLRTALSSGILGDVGNRLGFRHDLVRDAIYFDLPLSVRGGLHLQVGRALASAGAPPLQVAGHLARGAEPGDAEAVAWLRRAARQAAPRAPTIAVELLERAVDIAADGPIRDEVLAEYVWSLAWSGRPSEAEKLANDVLGRGLDASTMRAVRHALGVVLWLEGRVAESADQFDRLLTDPDLPPTDRAIVLARLTLRRLLSGDFAGSEAAARDALEASNDSGYELAASEAFGALCWVAAARGDIAESIELGRKAITLAANAEDPTGTFIAPRLYPQSRVYLGASLIDGDLIDEAADTLRQGLRIAEQQGADWALPVFHFGLAYCGYVRGEWDDAVAEIETASSMAAEIGTRNGVVYGYSILAHIALHRGDMTLAERAISDADAEIAAAGPAQYRVHWAMRARALHEEASGNIAGALGIVDAAWTLITGVGMVAEQRELGPDVCRLAMATGDDVRAKAAADAVEVLAERANVPSIHAAAMRCRALADGNADLALASVEAYRASGRLIDTALAAEDAARICALAGRNEDALRMCSEALATYERLGAGAGIARVEVVLRALGAKPARRKSRPRPRAGWESLTPTEVEVVRLAAAGLTNREIGAKLFVSRRTVETHLSHVFGKLGISTRVQLAAGAARAGI